MNHVNQDNYSDSNSRANTNGKADSNNDFNSNNSNNNAGADKNADADKSKNGAVLEKEPTMPKRTYAKRGKTAHTLASINELIEAKELEKEAIQAEIESLMVKRNELLFSESEGMGLIDLIADPEKAKWLARLVAESQA